MSAVPFLAVALVLLLVRRHGVIRRLFPIMRLGNGWVFPVLMGGFALFWTVSVVGVGLPRYFTAQSALRNGTAQVVEGRVENFHPMPYTGHDLERFDVSGVHFEYSDYVITSGFNKTSSHGGPVHSDVYVRIHYISRQDGNLILRLEVRE